MDKGCNDHKDTKETEKQPAFKVAQELGKIGIISGGIRFDLKSKVCWLTGDDQSFG